MERAGASSRVERSRGADAEPREEGRVAGGRCGAGVLALLCAVLAGCGESARLDALAQGPHGRAVRALSGDLLLLEGGTRVRLSGVEAPAAPAPEGEASREVLDALARGRAVDLLWGGARDDGTGAELAQVRLSGSRAWLEAALLDAGAVRVRTWTDDRSLAGDLLAHEAAARAARRGLWAAPGYGVRLPDELGWNEVGLQIVEGRVARVADAGGRTWLDFGRDWRGLAAVSVPRSARRDFAAAGLDLHALQGRMVRVRGPAHDRVLTVDHPEAVEVLKD